MQPANYAFAFAVLTVTCYYTSKSLWFVLL